MFKERISFGNFVHVRSDEQMPITMDGSASPIMGEDGKLRYFFTDLGEKPYHRVFIGSETDPFIEHDFNYEWDVNGYPMEWPSGLWAQTIYKCDDGMLIGIVHRENFSRIDKTSCVNYHIGLGVSHDGGHKWFYAGDLCGNECNYVPLRHANMGGCPTIVKDGYFYTYFNEFHYADKKNKRGVIKTISAARFSVQETIEALKNKKCPKAYKYSGDGKWETKGLGGTGAPIIKVSPWSNDPENLGIDSHSKAAYCKPLDCYLMTFQTGGNGELVMYFSKDAENWDEFVTVDTIPDCPEKGDIMQPYSCFVDISGEGRADNFTVGGKFLIHVVRKMISKYPVDEYGYIEVSVK